MASIINTDKSVFFSWLYSKKIADLKLEDNVFPKKIAFDQNYPFYWTSVSTLIPQ
jgi:hypothetical protein